MINELRRHFSKSELLELMMMTCQYIGFGRVLAILQLEETVCPNARERILTIASSKVDER
jgi:hypothetical protein